MIPLWEGGLKVRTKDEAGLVGLLAKQPCAGLVSHPGVSVSVPAAVFPIQHLCSIPGRATENGPCAWVSVTYN